MVSSVSCLTQRTSYFNMLPSVESLPRGQRLLPKLIDERADRDPNRVFASIPKSTDLTDGYQDVSYATVSRAIDRAAWWLYDATARAPAGSKFAWLGPMDLRYPIFLFAAMKCRYQVSCSFSYNDVIARVLQTARSF